MSLTDRPRRKAFKAAGSVHVKVKDTYIWRTVALTHGDQLWGVGDEGQMSLDINPQARGFN